MPTMTATEVSRNFSRVLDSFEHGEKEIEITRKNRVVARLVPEPNHKIFAEVCEKIYGVLSEEAADEWLKACESFDRPLSEEMRDPWE